MDTARQLFIDVVVMPALKAEELDRLRALCESFLSYSRTEPFLAAASSPQPPRSSAGGQAR